MPSAVHVHLQLRIVGDDGTMFTDCEILRLVKNHHQLEAVGLSIGESKSLQECLQQHIVTAQAAAFVNRHRCCPACGRHLCSKGKYPVVFRTVFGNVALSSPRFYRCGCHPADSQTFSPLTELLIEHTAPELLYLESRWASLIPFGLTAALLRDVLPVADTTNPETVRQHLHKVADRHEADLGTSEPGSRNDGPAAGQPSSIPREAIIVGIDGGYLRNWHDKQKKFEVIVGKSVPEVRDHRYLVQTHDDKPGHRLFEVLRAQDLRMNLTFLTDGGDSSFLDGISPCAEHYLDWFHITMRLTVLSQYAKGVAHHSPVEALALHSRLDRIKCGMATPTWL